MARLRKGGAIEPIAAYRKLGYREAMAPRRPSAGGNSSGIV
jgi:L-rhamnose isomerase/sugar isomerase